MSDRRGIEQMCIENECPQCHNVIAYYSPGPSSDHEITNRLCVDCRCWTDYWEDNRPVEMTKQEAMDTYDENQDRSRRRNNRTEGRE